MGETGRTLTTRQTSEIGIVCVELTNPFYAALPGLLNEAFAKHGYRTTFITDRGDQPLAIEPLLDASLEWVALPTLGRPTSCRRSFDTVACRAS